MPHRVVIAPTSLGNRGRQYAVTYSGKLLCESRTPVFAACRALLARVSSVGSRSGDRRLCADLQLDIVRGAGLAICETATESLRAVPWRPRSDVTFLDAVSRRGVQPLAAADETQVSESPSETKRPCLAIGGVAQRGSLVSPANLSAKAPIDAHYLSGSSHRAAGAARGLLQPVRTRSPARGCSPCASPKNKSDVLAAGRRPLRFSCADLRCNHPNR
jgi:hypothetical protein